MAKLQPIADRYERQGARGKALVRKLKADPTYQRIAAARARRLSPARRAVAGAHPGYSLTTSRDFQLFKLITTLEKLPLRTADRAVVALARTQLTHDWRTPLLATLQKIKKQYSQK